MRETTLLRWKFPETWFKKYGKVKFWELFDEFNFSVYENGVVVITGGAAFGFVPITGVFTYANDILIYSPLSGGLITISAGNTTVAAGESLYVETTHPIPTATLPLLAGSQKNARWHKTLPLGGRIGDVVHFRPNITVP
jgi:hypothetical protein